jgi:hypothetical protein
MIWLFTAKSPYDINRFIVSGPLLNRKFENWINKEHFPTLEAAMKAIDTALEADMKARENQKRIAVIGGSRRRCYSPTRRGSDANLKSGSGL